MKFKLLRVKISVLKMSFTPHKLLISANGCSFPACTAGVRLCHRWLIALDRHVNILLSLCGKIAETGHVTRRTLRSEEDQCVSEAKIHGKILGKGPCKVIHCSLKYRQSVTVF